MSDAGKKRGNRGGGERGNKRSKGNWGSSGHKDPSQKAIPANTWGMLLTCEGGRDKRAVDEARVLFEEAYERMGKSDVLKAAPAAAPAAGDEAAAPDAAAADAGGGGGGGGGKSVDALLAAEVAELKDVKRSPFRWHETGVANTIFVNFPQGEGAPAPSQVAANVVEHVKATKQLPARFLIKMLPIEATCFVAMDDIQKLAQEFMPKKFPSGDGAAATTFAVDMERRACSSLDHMEVVNAFAKAVPPPHKVNLSKPDATVLVQLIRNVCAVAVAPRFKALGKYNVRVAAEPEEEEEEEGAGGKAAAAAKGGEAKAEVKAEAKAAEGAGQQQEPAAAAEAAAGGSAEAAG